jgi:CHAT domain-containing protein
VLRRLTGAQPPPVQHLACHAFIEDSPARTYLLLAGMQQLTVGDLLIAAGGRRPEAPGATVSLAACTTNLAGRQHDESLTLATAFLVAGSASVVGSLWQVPDLRTALLMFMTHHYLQEAGATARDALRRAQLWMLDPGRALPDSMPDALARLAHTTDLTAPHGWAGFTHQGW